MKTSAVTSTGIGTVSRARRVPALRGALLLAFGLAQAVLILLAFRLPNVTVSVLVTLMSVFLVLDGIASLAPAFTADERSPWRVSQAVASLAAGGAILFAPTEVTLPIFACWSILTGLLQAVEAPASDLGRLVVAALSLVAGLVILVSPVRDPVRLLLVVTVYGVVAGALRLRRA